MAPAGRRRRTQLGSSSPLAQATGKHQNHPGRTSLEARTGATGRGFRRGGAGAAPVARRRLLPGARLRVEAALLSVCMVAAKFPTQNEASWGRESKRHRAAQLTVRSHKPLDGLVRTQPQSRQASKQPLSPAGPPQAPAPPTHSSTNPSAPPPCLLPPWCPWPPACASCTA